MATGGGAPLSIEVRWSPGAVKNFHLLDKSLQTIVDGWATFWQKSPQGMVNKFGKDEGAVDKIISDNIKRNLDQGVTPELKTWAPLSPKYAARVHRPRMMFAQTSPVYDAYVNQPTLLFRPNTLTYSPNLAIHEMHYSWLREGFITKGHVVPAREWFGLSEDYKEKIGNAMARITQQVMNQKYAQDMGISYMTNVRG